MVGGQLLLLIFFSKKRKKLCNTKRALDFNLVLQCIMAGCKEKYVVPYIHRRSQMVIFEKKCAAFFLI